MEEGSARKATEKFHNLHGARTTGNKLYKEKKEPSKRDQKRKENERRGHSEDGLCCRPLRYASFVSRMGVRLCSCSVSGYPEQAYSSGPTGRVGGILDRSKLQTPLSNRIDVRID